MKILVLDQGEHLGGAERFLAELLTRLSSNLEFHITVLHSGNPDYEELYGGSNVQLLKAEIPRLKPYGLGTWFKYRSAQKTLQKQIQDIKPDVILSNTVRTHLLISPLAHRLKIPLVWFAHDLTFPGLLLAWFKRYPQQIIACSQFVADAFRSPEKTSVLYPFGIEPENFHRLTQVHKSNTIGMVGKWIPWKGQDLFIELAHRLHQSHPDLKFKLVASSYVGNSDSKQFEQHCREVIERFSLRDVVQVVESVPDLLSEMASWKVLVHCSKEPEPLGRVILEGMAAGCTVFATDLGGPRELLPPRQLWNPNDLGDLARKVEAELKSPSDETFHPEKWLWESQMKIFEHILKSLPI